MYAKKAKIQIHLAEYENDQKIDQQKKLLHIQGTFKVDSTKEISFE